MARRHPGRPPDAHLHLGDHRATEGRPAHAPEHHGLRSCDRGPRPVRGGHARDLVAARGAHRGAGGAPLPADRLRFHDHELPEPPRHRLLPPAGEAQLVLRRAPDLGEDEGRTRGAAREPARGATDDGLAGDRRGAGEGPPGTGGAARARGPGGPRGPCRRVVLRDGAGHARPRRGRGGERGGRSHAARGARVLPRDRPAPGRAVGHVGDDRLGHGEPARANEDRHRRSTGSRGRDQARTRWRGLHPRRRRHGGLPQPPREDGRGAGRRGVARHRRRRRDRR